MADLLVHGGGTVYLLRPVSPAGTARIDEYISENATWFGGAVACTAARDLSRRASQVRWAKQTAAERRKATEPARAGRAKARVKKKGTK